ncbi:MAG: aminotransferase class V-fold PLP-dependent enzyme [Paludibacteraceae bacterium]|nr:aminotransferase class V-fold PLP-dependent enzyme [Paludibacteraceae bacterium]MCK9616133.1 aminotransferase class V-fold PLP-dependent enzyme [Candidatus Omnitrophota bacterium]
MSYLGNIENFDAAATTPCDERILKKIIPFFTDQFTNVDSSNGKSRKLRSLINQSAEKIAGTSSLQCLPEEVVFTSGGTEANNTIILGFPYNEKTIAVSATEHQSILKPAAKIPGNVIIPVLENGQIDIVALEDSLKTEQIRLVSVHAVNNETGAIQPISAIYKLCKQYGAFLHTDASQYWGKEKNLLDADYVTISGHKVHAPKGIGSLIIKSGSPEISPLLLGGGHQKGRRAGTLPTPLVVGMGMSTDYFKESYGFCEKIKNIRDNMIDDLKMYGNVVMNTDSSCQALFFNFSLTDIPASDVIAHMEKQHGIIISRGSACMEGKESHVIAGMKGKTTENACNSIRISWSKFNKTCNFTSLPHMIENSIVEMKKESFI